MNLYEAINKSYNQLQHSKKMSLYSIHHSDYFSLPFEEQLRSTFSTDSAQYIQLKKYLEKSKMTDKLYTFHIPLVSMNEFKGKPTDKNNLYAIGKVLQLNCSISEMIFKGKYFLRVLQIEPFEH